MRMRCATMDDADLLLQWRNDPTTRKWSRDTREIGLAEHRAWLKRVLRPHSDVSIQIAMSREQPVGVVRVGPVLPLGKREMSWTVSPRHRRRGHGTDMVRRVVQTYGRDNLVAFIKVDNVPSLRIAARAGVYVRLMFE